MTHDQLIIWAFLNGARWDAGEFVFRGIRYATRVEHGLPVMQRAAMTAIVEAYQRWVKGGGK